MEEQQRQLAAAMRRLGAMKLQECFDPINLDSRMTDAQQRIHADFGQVTHQYVVAGNQSGKSQYGARLATWVFNENHPHWSRRPEWGNEPLQILVLGRTTKQIEEVLWRKIEPFLEPGTFKVQRTGGVIQKVTHIKNRNTILFLSHHADNEAREKAQAFVAHFVWVDEMPKSIGMIEELHRRIQAREGFFLATFTPKVVNNEIRKLVDASDGVNSKKYQLLMLDNPLYAERKEKILQSLETYSQSYRDTILTGSWSVGEEQVYEFNEDTMVEAPPNYSRNWRHVESVDPALKSKFGLTLWAEDPASKIWYCVEATYFSGIYDPVEIYQAVQRKMSGYNIVRRVCDPHEAWYLGTAATARTKPAYMCPYDKNNRKGELIKNLQSSLGARLRIAPWCTDMIDEFVECRWAENSQNDKIVNSSRWHLLDTAQYFNDCLPKPEISAVPVTWEDWLWQGHHKRKAAERKKVEKAVQRTQIGKKRRRQKWNQH